MKNATQRRMEEEGTVRKDVGPAQIADDGDDDSELAAETGRSELEPNL